MPWLKVSDTAALHPVVTGPLAEEVGPDDQLDQTDLVNLTAAIDRVFGVLPGRPLSVRADTTGGDVLLSWTPPVAGGPVSTYVIEGGTFRVQRLDGRRIDRIQFTPATARTHADALTEVGR